VLDDPRAFKTKRSRSFGSLEPHPWQPKLYPDLYREDSPHVVRINYYPPRGDTKEGWDNIGHLRAGWATRMQIKVDFLCRDSILAAPLVLGPRDLLRPREAGGHDRHPGVAVFLLQEARRRRPGSTPSHDIFIRS